MILTDAEGMPLAAYVAEASVHESQLVETLLARYKGQKMPRYLIGDKGYDSDILDEKLRKLGIEMIAPHRRNRTKPKTQDGRKLRRAKRRCAKLHFAVKIERTNAWIKNHRRLGLRYEWYSQNFLGFVYLSFIDIHLKHL